MTLDEYKLLRKINSPRDLKQLSAEELRTYCDELRSYIIDECSVNPGHLASSLGCVELAAALHYVFDTPADKIVWDVGHQTYAHKIITGRREAFKTKRLLGGISGFPRMSESPYDAFGGGHASVSISAAFGMAKAAEMRGERHQVVAVIGDGSMTGGLAFEGLNNVIMYDGARTTFMHRDPFKSQTYFYNNVFYNKSTTTTTTWHDTKRYLGNLGSVTFSHNCFYEASGIHSQYEPSDDYKVTENPDMVNPGQTPQQNSDGILSGATVWDGYKLNASSPLIDAGIYVPQMGTTDFYGTQLYWGNAPDIGVHEYQQGEYNDPANFALGKTVTSNTSHESLTPDLMVDGIYSQSSRWAAANSDLPIWLDIDFGEDTTFNKVVLTENIVSGWASPRIASFNLQIPTSDGYQTIYTYDGEIGEGKDFTFDAVTASHLRMEITSLRADTSTHGRGATDPSIVEFEVYKVPVVREPQNLLLNKSVSASSSHFSCPASKVNDGDASQGSRWAAANSDLPAWLEFDLGSEQTFNSVTITENIVPNWASERITGLEFQAWNGTEYTTISTYSGTIGTSKTISLPETTSSKFKVLITGLQEDTTKNSKGQTDPSIQEIELYYR